EPQAATASAMRHSPNPALRMFFLIVPLSAPCGRSTPKASTRPRASPNRRWRRYCQESSAGGSLVRWSVFAGKRWWLRTTDCASGSVPEPAPRRRAADRRGVGRRQRDREHGAGVARVDDAVVPQPRGREVRIALLLDHALGHRLHDAELLLVDRLAALGRGLALDDVEHTGELLAAHDGDPVVGPGEQEPWRVGPAAHRVGAGAVARARQDRDRGDRRVRHRVDQLGAVLDDALLLVLLADHEAGDVLEEHQRHVARVAQLDELRALLRALGEQDTVVGEDADRIAVDVGPAA